MTDKQKRALIITLSVFVVILSAVGVAMLIYGGITKDQVAHIFGLVTSIISPSFIFGFIVKVITNKIHIRNIERANKEHTEAVEDALRISGIKLSKMEKVNPKTLKINSKPYFQSNGCTFYVTDNMVYIEFEKKDNDVDTYKFLFANIGNFQEQIRKDINF